MRRFEGRACFWEAEGRVLSKTPTHLRGGRVSPRVSPWKGHYYVWGGSDSSKTPPWGRSRPNGVLAEDCRLLWKRSASAMLDKPVPTD